MPALWRSGSSSPQGCRATMESGLPRPILRANGLAGALGAAAGRRSWRSRDVRSGARLWRSRKLEPSRGPERLELEELELSRDPGRPRLVELELPRDSGRPRLVEPARDSGRPLPAELELSRDPGRPRLAVPARGDATFGARVRGVRWRMRRTLAGSCDPGSPRCECNRALPEIVGRVSAEQECEAVLAPERVLFGVFVRRTGSGSSF